MLRSCHCPFKSVSLQSVNTTNTSFTRRLQWQSAQLEWTWVGRVCFVERETKWAWFLSIDASHTCVCVCLVRSGQVSASVCVLVSLPRPAPPRRALFTPPAPGRQLVRAGGRAGLAGLAGGEAVRAVRPRRSVSISAHRTAWAVGPLGGQSASTMSRVCQRV